MQESRFVSRMLWCAVLVLLVWGNACSSELVPEEPQGAYLLWRQALLRGDTEGVYEYLDQDTRKLLDERAEVLAAMSEDIARYLPQVDQRLARKQTGVVLRKQKGVKDGRALFNLLFTPDKLEMTPEIEVGLLISDLELNEAGDTAAIKTDGGDQFILVKEEDGIWRVTSWKKLCEERTQWILDNRSALEQTVQDLISEEQEEVGAVIDYLLAQEKKRQAAAPAKP